MSEPTNQMAFYKGPEVTLEIQQEAPQITQLMHAAIEKGASVETLEKLVGLYERVEDRRAAGEFTAALLAFQKQCPPIKKNRDASFVTKSGGTFAYTFADLPQVCRTVNDILHPLGLTYHWDSAVSQDGGRMSVTCTLSHVAGHSVTATFEAPIDKGTGTSSAQDYAKVQTYGERQSLVQVLGIYTADEDTDAVPGSDEKITEEQVNALNVLMQEVGYKDPRLLYKMMGIARLPDLPRSQYDIMVRAIGTKRAPQ